MFFKENAIQKKYKKREENVNFLLKVNFRPIILAKWQLSPDSGNAKRS